MSIEKRLEKVKKLERKLRAEREKLRKEKRRAEAKVSILIAKAVLKKAQADGRLGYVARDLLSVLEEKDVDYIVEASSLLTDASWEPLRKLVEELSRLKKREDEEIVESVEGEEIGMW